MFEKSHSCDHVQAGVTKILLRERFNLKLKFYLHLTDEGLEGKLPPAGAYGDLGAKASAAGEFISKISEKIPIWMTFRTFVKPFERIAKIWKAFEFKSLSP